MFWNKKKKRKLLMESLKGDGSTISEKRTGPLNVKLMFGCIIASVVLYMILIAAEKSLINKEETKEVYVAIKNIPEMMLITEENISEYFAKEERAVSTLMGDAIEDSQYIVNSFVVCDVYEKQIAFAKMFKKEKDIIDDIENPIEISFTAGSLPQTVGGVLRAGDLINIWSVNVNVNSGVKENSAALIYKGAYVSRAFTSSGNEISRDSGEEEATTIINIIIPADKEEEFNKAIINGTLRISRIMYDDVKEKTASERVLSEISDITVDKEDNE